MTEIDASTAVLSADRYDPPKAKEYQELMDIIHRRGKYGDDVYTNLMNTEERVLNTVDRVVNDSRLQTVQADSFLNMSLLEIAGRTAEVLRDTYLDLLRVREIRDVPRAFSKKSRRIYLGLVLVALALVLMVLNASVTSTSYS